MPGRYVFNQSAHLINPHTVRLCIYLCLRLSVPTHSERCWASSSGGRQAKGRVEKEKEKREMKGSKTVIPSLCIFSTSNLQFETAAESNFLLFGEWPQETGCLRLMENICEQKQRVIVLVSLSHSQSRAASSESQPIQTSLSVSPQLTMKYILFHITCSRSAFNRFGL